MNKTHKNKLKGEQKYFYAENEKILKEITIVCLVFFSLSTTSRFIF
jgi:capsule polysaccharide export protein KpsE/RkpR